MCDVCGSRRIILKFFYFFFFKFSSKDENDFKTCPNLSISRVIFSKSPSIDFRNTEVFISRAQIQIARKRGTVNLNKPKINCLENFHRNFQQLCSARAKIVPRGNSREIAKVLLDRDQR